MHRGAPDISIYLWGSAVCLVLDIVSTIKRQSWVGIFSYSCMSTSNPASAVFREAHSACRWVYPRQVILRLGSGLERALEGIPNSTLTRWRSVRVLIRTRSILAKAWKAEQEVATGFFLEIRSVRMMLSRFQPWCHQTNRHHRSSGNQQNVFEESASCFLTFIGRLCLEESNYR